MHPPQMSPIPDIGVRLSVFFMMIVVGTVAHLVALPALGGVLILALPMARELVAGARSRTRRSRASTASYSVPCCWA